MKIRYSFARLLSCMVSVVFISAWAILLFVQQYRALLTASECGSNNGRFTLFYVHTHAYRSQVFGQYPSRYGAIQYHIGCHHQRRETLSGFLPICTGLTSDVLPKAPSCQTAEGSQAGVSTGNALSYSPQFLNKRHRAHTTSVRLTTIKLYCQYPRFK